MVMENSTLHIPQGINYECQGCGKCCGGWAVPMTEEDYDRISAVEWTGVNAVVRGKGLYRELKKYESANTPYTHKIMEGDDGHCPFLVDKLCHIHAERGMEFKPTICQLFPYCFSETPSGVYATVSVVSMGVVYNSGLPLADQREFLEKKWGEFRKLYPDYKPDWSHTKLSVDKPIAWEEYLKLEEKLIAYLNDTSKPLEQRLWDCSVFLRSQMSGAGSEPPAAPSLEDAPPLNALDRSVLAVFHKMYFPAKPAKQGDGDFNIMRMLGERFLGSKRIQLPGQSFSISELLDVPFPHDPDVDNLLYRYVFSYVYGKKYFGAGFGQVSIIAGFHHIILMLALLKLHARALAKMRQAPVASMVDVVATVRQLERMVGETRLGGYSVALWEMLLTPGSRARKLLAHV
jgi:Fe-S-cluster containining protein